MISRHTNRRGIVGLMKASSRLGDGHFYPLFGVILAIQHPYLLRTMIPAMMAAFAVEVTIQLAVKAVIRRPRPFRHSDAVHARVRPPDDFSFPSGHAAGAFVMATFVTAVYPGVAVPCYLLAALVAVSRVANGVHYPSDVIAGATLGLASANASLLVMVSA